MRLLEPLEAPYYLAKRDCILSPQSPEATRETAITIAAVVI